MSVLHRKCGVVFGRSLTFWHIGLIYQLPPQIYMTGDKPLNSHFKLSCRNCCCSFFYSTLNECALLHLVTEYTFNFPDARSELNLSHRHSGCWANACPPADLLEHPALPLLITGLECSRFGLERFSLPSGCVR